MDRVLWPYRRPVWSALGESMDVTVAVFDEQEPNRPRWPIEQLPNVQVRHLPSFRMARGRSRENPLYFAPGGSRLVRDVRPDVIVLSGWESPAHQQICWTARALGAAHVQFYGGTPHTHRFDSGPVAAIRSAFFRSVHSVIAYSPAAADEIKRFGVPLDRIFVGFNSPDVSKFHEQSKSVHRTHSAGHVFLSVGQLIPRKNNVAIISAFDLIAEDEDRLLFVGVGPEEASLRAAAAASRRASQISFYGFRDGADLVQAYGDANSLVLASTEEVWGLVVNEALACGLHAVVSSHAGAASGVDGMRGVWVADPNVSDLARAMAESRKSWNGHISNPEILNHTPRTYAATAEEAIRHALQLKGGR